MVGRARDSGLLAFVDGVGRARKVAACLDLDSDQQPGAPRDDVDLSDRAAVAPGDKPESLEAQQQGRLALGPMAAPFGGLPAAFHAHGAALNFPAPRR